MKRRILAFLLAICLAGTQPVGDLTGIGGLSRVFAEGEDEEWDREWDNVEDWSDDDDDDGDDKRTGRYGEDPEKETISESDKEKLEDAWRTIRTLYESTDDEDWKRLLGRYFGYNNNDEEKRKWASEGNALLFRDGLTDEERRFYDDLLIASELYLYAPERFSYGNTYSLIDFLNNGGLTEESGSTDEETQQGGDAGQDQSGDGAQDTGAGQDQSGDGTQATGAGSDEQQNGDEETDSSNEEDGDSEEKEKETEAYLFPTLIPEGLTSKEADKVYTMFNMENPQFYFLDYTCTDFYESTVEEGEEIAKTPVVFPAFINGEGVDAPDELPGVTLSDFAGMQKSVEEAKKEIEKDDPRFAGGNKWKKIQCIHDWLVEAVDYDQFAGGYVPVKALDKSLYIDFVRNNGYLNKDKPTEVKKDVEYYCANRDYTMDQSMYSVFGRAVGADYPVFFNADTIDEPRYEKERVDAFTDEKIDHYTVCAGYSAAFTYLCNKLLRDEGVHTVSMVGSSHQWNVVYMNGEYYNIDVTWDDVGGKNEAYPLGIEYEYFARDDAFFLDGHNKEEEFKYNPLPCNKDIKPFRHAYLDVSQKGDFRVCIGDAENKLLYELDKDAEGNHTLKMNNGAYVFHQMTDDLKSYVHTLMDQPGTDSHKDPVLTAVKETSQAIVQALAGSGSAPAASPTPASGTTVPTSAGTGGSGGGGSASLSFSQGGTITAGKGSSQGNYTKESKGNVAYSPSAKSMKAKKLKVPNKVKIGKKTYKVSRIAANAFTGFDKLKELTLGKNIRIIEPNAFSGLKNLKKLTIRSRLLTAKGIKNAFKDSAIRRVYVPQGKVRAYRKIFTKKNTGSRYKITVKAIPGTQ